MWKIEKLFNSYDQTMIQNKWKHWHEIQTQKLKNI